MLPYVIPMAITILAVFRYDIGGHKGYARIAWRFLFIYLVVLMGLRYGVGGDTAVYMDSYDKYPTLGEFRFRDIMSYGTQPFFALLSIICRSVTTDFTFFQIVHAILLNLCVFRFLSRNTELRFTALFFYMLLALLYFNTEILKESLAIAAFLAAYPCMKRKKWVKYYLWVVVACMFHISAIILIFMPAANYIRFDKRFLIMAAAFTMLILSVRPYLELMETLEVIGDKVSMYREGSEAGKLNVNWVIFNSLKVSIAPLCLLVYQKYVLGETSPLVPMVCVHVIIGIGVVFYQLVFSRFSNYTVLFYVIFLADLFARRRNIEPLRKRGLQTALALCIAVYGYYYFSGGSGNSRIYERWVPYMSVFDTKY